MNYYRLPPGIWGRRLFKFWKGESDLQWQKRAQAFQYGIFFVPPGRKKNSRIGAPLVSEYMIYPIVHPDLVDRLDRVLVP